MAQDESTKTYADLALKQGRPSMAEPPDEFDLPTNSVFRSAQKDIIGKNVKPGKSGIELNYLSFSKVFVLWRPWDVCARCAAALNDDNIEIRLPDVGDYVCPHVQEAEFKVIRDKCLSGDFLLDRQEFFNLRDGTRCVHISWLEVDAEKLKQLDQLKRVRDKMDNIFPHDPTKK